MMTFVRIICLALPLFNLTFATRTFRILGPIQICMINAHDVINASMPTVGKDRSEDCMLFELSCIINQ